MTTQPWIPSYPKGVRWDAPVSVTAVQDVLREAAGRWPERVALDFMGGRLTYRELDAHSDRLAAGLQAQGVGKGVHVGIYLPNTPHYFVAFFAILKAGGVVVNYSPLDAASVLEHKIGDSETQLLITLDMKALYPQMRALLGHAPLRTLIVGSLGDYAGSPEAVAAALDAAGERAAVEYGPQIVRFTDLLALGAAPEEAAVADPARTLAVLQYTGGTTGLPKGAMLTHGNLTAATTQLWHTTQAEPAIMRPGEERVLAVLPPFHIYALVVNMLFAIKLGAEVVLHTRFEMPAVLRDLATRDITVFCGVPTMFFGLLQTDLEALNLKSLRFCNSGGAPLPVQVQDDFQARAGAKLLEGWGMTETTALGTFTPAHGVRHPGSCGIPGPGIELRFTDITDPARVLPFGERGEIGIRGPNIMAGYWKNPKATAEMISPDGFLRTGDVGYMDADGYVYIVDRTKDMLLCGGYNVYPRVIEEALYQHPAVAEAAVIGIADAYRGQAPKAFVRLREGADEVSLDDMKAFLKPLLGKHEMIAALAVVEALPRTPVGKIDKKPLYAAEGRA